jgi:hypothetical protein
MQRSYIPSFYFYKFANLVSGPYTDLSAFKSGAIDANGNLTGSESEIDPFEYFVLKLKKIFEQLPPGSTKYKLNNIFGTLQLFSESVEEIGITKEQMELFIESKLIPQNLSYLELKEDMTTGAVAGSLGVPSDAPNANTGNVSGFDPILNSNLQVRSTNSGGIEMFNIPHSEFRLIKKTKSFPKNKIGNYLKRYNYRNNYSKIAVRDEETGEIYWLSKSNKKSPFGD